VRSYLVVAMSALALVLAAPAGAHTAAGPAGPSIPAKRKPKPPRPPEVVPLYGIEPGATKPLGIPETAPR
jgi:hypothetical protein